MISRHAHTTSYQRAIFLQQKTGRSTDRQTETKRQTQRETQRERQRHRDRDRQTDRDRETEREREIISAKLLEIPHLLFENREVQ